MKPVADTRPFLIIDSPDFVIRARSRHEGTSDRRPDAATSAFQSDLVCSFVDVPSKRFHYCAVTVDVPDDGCLPLAATMKAVIDALKPAGIIRDDRCVLAARIRKYHLDNDADPVVNVEVLPREKGVASFIRSFPQQHDTRVVTRAVTAAVPYRDRSGVAGPAKFTTTWATNSAEYEAVLRQQWQSLQESGAITLSDPGDISFTLTGRLIVHLPKRLTEDGDNALLYVIDMLELARRDALLEAAGGQMLDELLVEVAFVRDLDSGVYVTATAVEQFNQYDDSIYYLGEGEPIDPFNPDSPC